VGSDLVSSRCLDALIIPLVSGAVPRRSAMDYDGAGHLSSVSDFEGNTIAVSDTADGIPDQMTLGPSGESVVTSYDSTDSPSSIELNGTSGTLLGFSYSDTPAGNVSQESDTPSVSYSPASYHYDIQSRVTSDTPGSRSTLNYTEDASGNLTTLPTGSSASYNDASELIVIEPVGHDDELLLQRRWRADREDRGLDGDGERLLQRSRGVTAYSDASADMTSATYDGNRLRSSDTVGSSTQGFVWDERGIGARAVDGRHQRLHLRRRQRTKRAGEPRKRRGQLPRLRHLGSVRGVVSSTGALSASTAYHAWGNPETSGGLSSYTPFGFAGGYTDPIGLVYLIHRYYDPATGQFFPVDPDLQQTQQPYVYTNDDPVNEVDIQGTSACPYPWEGMPTEVQCYPTELKFASESLLQAYAYAQCRSSGCRQWPIYATPMGPNRVPDLLLAQLRSLSLSNVTGLSRRPRLRTKEDKQGFRLTQAAIYYRMERLAPPFGNSGPALKERRDRRRSWCSTLSTSESRTAAGCPLQFICMDGNLDTRVATPSTTRRGLAVVLAADEQCRPCLYSIGSMSDQHSDLGSDSSADTSSSAQKTHQLRGQLEGLLAAQATGGAGSIPGLTRVAAPPGYTIAVADDLEPFVTAYADVFLFEGANRSIVEALITKLPSACLDLRLEGAPSLRHMLEKVASDL
jgi:RHS repeat-associated protein